MVVGSHPMCAGNSNYIIKCNKRSGLMKNFGAPFQGYHAEPLAHDLGEVSCT